MRRFVAGALTAGIVALNRIAIGGGGLITGLVGWALFMRYSVAALAIFGVAEQTVSPLNLVWLSLAVVGGVYAIYALRIAPSATETVLPTLREIVPVWLALMAATIVFIGSIIVHFERGQVLASTLNERESDLRAISTTRRWRSL